MSSDRTGEELGIGRQREDVTALIARRGWTLVEEYAENDTSAAGKRRRPKFEELLRVIRAGEVDAVAAWALDRLTRTARDRLALVEACRESGVMIALVRGSDIDPTTPAGRLTAGVLGEVAQHEIDQKSDRQRAAVVQAARQGRRVGGRRPFGYDGDGTTVREDEAAAIRRAYSDLLDGVSLGQIARDWNGLGLRSGQTSWRPETKGQPTAWSHDTVRMVLRNARNAGIRTHRGEEVGPAQWPAIVPVETFRAAQAVLSDAGRSTGGTGRVGRQLLTGVALCARCGLTVHGGGAWGGKATYRCSGRAHLARAREPIDAYVSDVMIALLARDLGALLVDQDRPDAGALRDEAAALRARMDSLAVEFADGSLTASQLRAANDRLRDRLADVERRQADVGRSTLLRPFAGADDVRVVWEALDVDRRRAVIDTLAVVRLHPAGKGVRTFRPESVEVEWRSA